MERYCAVRNEFDQPERIAECFPLLMRCLRVRRERPAAGPEGEGEGEYDDGYTDDEDEYSDQEDPEEDEHSDGEGEGEGEEGGGEGEGDEAVSEPESAYPGGF
eukprot:tig00001479_g8904.t1